MTDCVYFFLLYLALGKLSNNLYGGELYLEMNINTRLRSCLTKLRLSSHKYLVERGRWLKP